MGRIETMAEDIATETGLLSSVSSGATLSPSAIVALLLEIQSSLLETHEHAHLADTAEDLLFGLARSMKKVEALNVSSVSSSGKTPVTVSEKQEKPKLWIVTNS